MNESADVGFAAFFFADMNIIRYKTTEFAVDLKTVGRHLFY